MRLPANLITGGFHGAFRALAASPIAIALALAACGGEDRSSGGAMATPTASAQAISSPPAFVQERDNQVSSGTTNSLAFNQGNVAGNLIIAYLIWNNTGAVTVSDSRGNTYVSAAGPTRWGSGSAWSAQIFYAKNVAAGTNTVTATFAKAITSFGIMYLHEYSGIDPTAPMDATSSAAGTTASISSGTANSAYAGDLLFAGGASDGAVARATSGYTSRSLDFGNLTEDRVATSAGAYSASTTNSGSFWVMQLATFKAAGAAQDTQSPLAPTNLVATAVSATQTALSWTASTDNVGVAGYRVFRNGNQVATTASTSYADSGLSPATTYTYQVTAFDAAQNSSLPSAAATAKTFAQDSQPPSTPTNLTATPVSSSQIDLFWTASTDNVGVAGYRVFRNGNQVATTASTSYADSGLSPGTSCTYQVTAFDAAHNSSSPSGPATATTLAQDTQPPSTPRNLTATPVSTSRIDLSWTASTDNVGVAGYTVYRGGVPVATVTGTSYSSLNLAAGSTYSYTVSAFDAASNASVQSSPVTASTLPNSSSPSVPMGLTAVATSSSQINLAWAASTDDVGVVGYRVVRDGAVIATTAAIQYTDAGLSPQSTHTYSVAAFDAAGNASAQSAPATGTTFGTSSVPTLVQHVSSSSNPRGVGISGNRFTISLPNAVRPGNCLILGVAYLGSTFTTRPVTDGTSNSWPTTPTASVTDTNHNVNLAIFVLPNAKAGATTITVSFNAPVLPFSYSLSEFYNVATTSPLNGSASASNVVAPNISTGSFVPGDNDGNGGNLIWALFWDDTNPGSGHAVTNFAAGAGYTLLDADIAWRTDANAHHASEYMVQTTAATIKPGMTATMSPANDSFVGLAIALKAASAGTPPPATGIRIVHMSGQTNELPPSSWPMQFPSSGNLVVAVTSDNQSIMNVAGVTDSNFNAYRRTEPDSSEPQWWIAQGATTGPDLKLTATVSGKAAGASWTFYDIVNAATSGQPDASAGVPVVSCSNQTTLVNFPIISPARANGLAIAAVGMGQGPGLGVTSPPGAVFDFSTYAGELDTDTMNNADCRAHVYTSSTAALNWNWTIASIGNNSCFASSIHLASQ